ncbi:hypothetical protein KKC06_03635 [Patescibacteria group bacterium]|nr:hypothetical protein [Patescibacteria group bacterium]
MNNQDILNNITKELSSFNLTNNDKIVWLKEKGEQIIKICSDLSDSWSNSFAGWHGRMYYKNFEKPSIRQRFSPEWGGINGIPDGWSEKQADEVKVFIENKMNDSFDLNHFEKETLEFIDIIKSSQTKIVGLFYSLDPQEEHNKSLLQTVEKFIFGRAKNKFIQQNIPGNVMTRDANALSEGICIPPHLYYQAVGVQAESAAKGTKEFIDLSTRLIIQLHENIPRNLKREGSIPEKILSITSLLKEQLRKLNKPVYISTPDHRECKEWISETTATLLKFDKETGVYFSESSKFIDDQYDESIRKNYLNLMERILRNAVHGVKRSDLKVEIDNVPRSVKYFSEIPENEKIDTLINEVNNVLDKEKFPNLIAHQFRTILRLSLIFWWEDRKKQALTENQKNYLDNLIKHTINNATSVDKKSGSKIAKQLIEINKYKTLTDRLIHDQKTIVADLELNGYMTILKNILSYCFSE